MAERSADLNQAEVDSFTPESGAGNQGFLRTGDHLIGETIFEAEEITNSRGLVTMVRLLPKPRKEHTFGPGDVIVS